MASLTGTAADLEHEPRPGLLGQIPPLVWLVTDDASAGQAMVKTLAGHARFAPLLMARDLSALLSRLDNGSGGGSAVVVDIDPDPSGMLAELAPIISRHPDDRFVVLSENFQPELVLEAMQVGARHFLTKQSISHNLVSVLDRLVSGSTAAAPQGSIVTVLSAGGGCGATTVALNLANELRLDTSSPSMLIDLDAAYGGAAAILGLSGQYGVADLLSDNNRLDGQLISSTARRFDQDLHVLLSPVSINPDYPRDLSFDRLEAVLDGCRSLYRWVIVDGPRVPIEAAARLALASRSTLIVLQMSIKDVRTARAMRQTLIGRGVPGDRLRFVVTRYVKRDRALPLEEVTKALGAGPIDLLANDYRAALAGVNMGQLLSDAAPRSGLRQDLRQMAQAIQQTPVRSGA